MSHAPVLSARVLLFCQPVSFGHVVRALWFARWLRERFAVELTVFTSAAARGAFAAAGFPIKEVACPDKEAVYARLVAGGQLFTEEDLRRELAEDERLIETHRPALVVSEFRFSALEVARRRGIPCVCLTEAGCLPGYDACGPFPDAIARTLPLPLALLDWLGSRPRIATPMQRHSALRLGEPLWRAFGKNSPRRGFFDYATRADLCLVSDLPELMPADLRPQDVYTGPVFWDRDDPLPHELATLERGRKTVYISIGTQRSLDPRLLDEALDRLLALGVQIIFSLGGRDVAPPAPRARLHIVSFVNDARLLPRVDLVIYPGGAMTTYEALRAGVPLLALPQHVNQHFYAWRVKQSGAGDWLRPSEFSADRLVERVLALIASEAPKQKARKFAARIANFDSDAVLHSRLVPLLPAGTVRRANRRGEVPLSATSPDQLHNLP